MSGVADEAGKLIDDNSRTLAPVAVGSQVALMSIVSVNRSYHLDFAGYLVLIALHALL